eukprot:CAMPEP_0194275312 /NCGR_PEP_ID=MMETSP0169-20130528/8181_1 /TAXON_ID=218684 /ORGANISM="Corethron pennatum, Strain L29A3" /LENGTH=739 /DNA_ID=CAMNT_0039018739 /DNA_START=179 /DNA_END=2398 /DNA_ORIENTATION=-
MSSVKSGQRRGRRIDLREKSPARSLNINHELFKQSSTVPLQLRSTRSLNLSRNTSATNRLKSQVNLSRNSSSPHKNISSQSFSQQPKSTRNSALRKLSSFRQPTSSRESLMPPPNTPRKLKSEKSEKVLFKEETVRKKPISSNGINIPPATVVPFPQKPIGDSFGSECTYIATPTGANENSSQVPEPIQIRSSRSKYGRYKPTTEEPAEQNRSNLSDGDDSDLEVTKYLDLVDDSCVLGSKKSVSKHGEIENNKDSVSSTEESSSSLYYSSPRIRERSSSPKKSRPCNHSPHKSRNRMLRKRNGNHVDMQFPTDINTYLPTVEEATSTESEEDSQPILFPEQERNENHVHMQFPTTENTYLHTVDERATESEENFHRILYPEQDDYRSARSYNEHSSQIHVETENGEDQAQDEKREVKEFQNLKEKKVGKVKREKKYQMKFEDTSNAPKKSTEDNLRDLLKSISEKKEKKGGYSVRGQEHGTITESIILKQLNESSLNETQNFDFDENIHSTSATHASTGIHDDFQNRDSLNEIFSTNATHTSTGSYDDFQNHDGLHGSKHDVCEMDHTERYGKIISQWSHTNGSSNAKNMNSSSHANHDQDVIDSKRSRGLFVPNISSKNGIQSENDVSPGIDIKTRRVVFKEDTPTEEDVPSRKVIFKEDTQTKEGVPSHNVRFIENHVEEPYDEREESIDYDYLSSNDYDGRDMRSFATNESDIYELDYPMSNPLDMLKGALISYF